MTARRLLALALITFGLVSVASTASAQRAARMAPAQEALNSEGSGDDAPDQRAVAPGPVRGGMQGEENQAEEQPLTDQAHEETGESQGGEQ